MTYRTCARRSERALLSVAALATFAVMVAGCGNGSAGTGNSTAVGGDGTTASIHEQALRFASCMRRNGVGDFPDPAASGSLTIDGVVNGSSLDPNSPAFKRALEACRSLEPPGFVGAKATPRQEVVRLEFARCMRENGVPDFPDPTPTGPLVDTNRIPSASTPGGMSALNAAMHKCGALYAGELGLTGR
jgi:hypothetical protein